ncbi:hypothetical protein Tco_1343740 [Tanacetum coccineum]
MRERRGVRRAGTDRRAKCTVEKGRVKTRKERSENTGKGQARQKQVGNHANNTVTEVNHTKIQKASKKQARAKYRKNTRRPAQLGNKRSENSRLSNHTDKGDYRQQCKGPDTRARNSGEQVRPEVAEARQRPQETSTENLDERAERTAKGQEERSRRRRPTNEKRKFKGKEKE